MQRWFSDTDAKSFTFTRLIFNASARHWTFRDQVSEKSRAIGDKQIAFYQIDLRGFASISTHASPVFDSTADSAPIKSEEILLLCWSSGFIRILSVVSDWNIVRTLVGKSIEERYCVTSRFRSNVANVNETVPILSIYPWLWWNAWSAYCAVHRSSLRIEYLLTHRGVVVPLMPIKELRVLSTGSLYSDSGQRNGFRQCIAPERNHWFSSASNKGERLKSMFFSSNVLCGWQSGERCWWMATKNEVNPSSKIGVLPFTRIERRRRNVEEETRPLQCQGNPIGSDKKMAKPTLF